MNVVASHPTYNKTEIKIIPVSRAVGAEIRGVDLSQPLNDDTFAAIYQAWLDYGVLLFRDQRMTVADQVAFSRRFGELDISPPQENGQKSVPGFPELFIISNVIENGELIGSLGSGELVWHMDMTYIDTPPKAICLRALEVPERGGDTGFINAYKAYEEMPKALRARIEGLTIKHDATHNSAGYLRSGLNELADITTSLGAIHPIVLTHPESGRKNLYLGRRPYAYIPGLSIEDSEALLDELWDWIDQPQFYWHHQWQSSDILLWDNRCIVHRRNAFDSSARRILHRTQIRDHKTS
ncbi:MAG: TauD/TfdA family dioxygenase [Coleofasciculaceae cyanobacterium]